MLVGKPEGRSPRKRHEGKIKTNLKLDGKGWTGLMWLRTGTSGKLGTKCNNLTQQFIGISTTIDTWATCFDPIESSSGPQRLQIQLLQGSQVHCGIPNAYIIVS